MALEEHGHHPGKHGAGGDDAAAGPGRRLGAGGHAPARSVRRAGQHGADLQRPANQLALVGGAGLLCDAARLGDAVLRLPGVAGGRRLRHEPARLLGHADHQLRLLGRRRPVRDDDLRHPAAGPRGLAAVPDAHDRDPDPVRAGRGGDVPAAAHRAQLVLLLDAALPQRAAALAQLSQPADLGRLGHLGVFDYERHVLVRRPDPGLRHPARPDASAGGGRSTRSCAWAGAGRTGSGGG